jgi:hypothetical protein
MQAKVGIDQIALRVIGESLTNLSKSTGAIIGYLRELTDYNREAFKLDLRTAARPGPNDAGAAALKKKYAAAAPGKPFYPDLAEEVIREDYSRDGPALREKALASLAIPQTEAHAVRQEVSYKHLLLEGALSIGSASAALMDCGLKCDENSELLASRKLGLWEKIKNIMRQMVGKEQDEIVYTLEFMDPSRGVSVKEDLNFRQFRVEMDRKNRVLAGLASRGTAYTRLESMPEEQIVAWLEKNIREVQSVHKTLTGLDEYFKTEATREERERIKGIKPELSTVKNAILRANQLRHEYGAQKEEEEQMKRLGVNPAAGPEQ